MTILRSLILGLCLLSLLACAKSEYAVVKVCSAPFMRHSSASIVKRVEDGKLFVLYDNGQLLPADPTADTKNLCP